MTNPQSALDELAALKAEYASRIEQIKAKALSELREQLKHARNEVARIENEIAQLAGNVVVQPSVESKPLGRRLTPIVEGSEDWTKYTNLIAITLKHHPEGLNGKQIANNIGIQKPREIRRIQPIIAATTWRDGEGAATKYFLNR